MIRQTDYTETLNIFLLAPIMEFDYIDLQVLLAQPDYIDIRMFKYILIMIFIDSTDGWAVASKYDYIDTHYYTD